ncbi:transglutaminase domain-containing protein [Desertihabitans aurantiacus]|uniref:transglutaminase domain-containing protein n=1 Tax=Desertihabitans aurantiacus TaxID=2282477 RepID=UPI000DF7C0E5|nr:transglutaminase domain-containing protein [Desertihabitans aurantiacus]
MVDVDVFARQSRFSDPGRHAARLQEVPDDLSNLCAVSRNLVAHYRAELPDLPQERWPEVDSRWVEAILDLDSRRHPDDLTRPRATADKVAGCCRDHSLLVVGALRQRGVPARTRVGFAHYFASDWAADHVVAERWQDGRWRRADPELGDGHPFDVLDIPAGHHAPFETAAEAWLGWRAGDRDLSRYGVYGAPELAGPDFVRTYVVFEVAHRFGDEMLLWDGWEATEHPLEPTETDELARLLVTADAGDASAEDELAARYREDVRLHPGDHVTTYSPFDLPPRTVDLTPRV